MRPLIGITTDIMDLAGQERCVLSRTYARAVASAGATPVLLGHDTAQIGGLIARLDGFVLTGGDDPAMEAFGVATDPRVRRVHPDRQAFEVGLLAALAADAPDKPVLGVCLGMQMMALVAGGGLEQYMPDRGDAAALHWEHEHALVGAGGWPFGGGPVLSRHKQAVSAAGGMRVVATAPDGVIEAIDDPGRRFYLGVQWHPERTADVACGADIFAAFIRAVS
jgi:putative glutamine amidotransferase